MDLSKSELRRGWEQERRRNRRDFWLAGGITLAVFLLCCSVRYNAYAFPDKFVPAQYLKSDLLALRLVLARLTGGSVEPTKEALIRQLGEVTYLGAVARLRITLMALVAGAGLAMSGAIFQTAYQNPMASPNILGASAGVRLGNVLVILLYSAAAVEHIYLRYAYCYGFTAVCVLGVLLLGKLAGDRKKTYSTLEMVMAGSIVSQGLNVVTMYIMYNLADEDMLLYQEVSMGMYLQTDAVSTGIFFAVMALGILPVLLLRYRMNAMGMDRLETAALGVRIGPLRLVGQVCGVLMVTCAMIHCGEAGMLSLVVPHVVRRYVGADFRRVCGYSAMAGGCLMMVCRMVSSLFLVLSEPVPVAFLTNLVLMPAFMVILAKQRGRIG